MKNLITILLFMSFSFGQEINKSNELLKAINANYSAINDFTTEIKVDINLPGFRMPNKKVKYFYKAPNKSKIEARGFAFVPKDGILPFSELVQQDSLVSLHITETIGDTIVLTFLDTFQTQEALMTLYVHEPTATIVKGMATINKHNILSFNIEYNYINNVYVPKQSHIKLLLPPDFRKIQMLGTSPVRAKRFQDKMKNNKNWVEGNIHLDFSEYEINQGLPDYIFEDEEETVD